MQCQRSIQLGIPVLLVFDPPQCTLRDQSLPAVLEVNVKPGGSVEPRVWPLSLPLPFLIPPISP
jgi:hypothetical protein